MSAGNWQRPSTLVFRLSTLFDKIMDSKIIFLGGVARVSAIRNKGGFIVLA